MAVALRAQCSFGADTAFPRDRVCITPHFNDTSAGNEQTLADDLASRLDTWFAGAREVVVKVYHASGPKPHPPLGTSTKQPGLTPATQGNRETAICLSFYATNNAPRRRGRLYFPAFFFTVGALPVRPASGTQTAVGAFATLLAAAGPASIQWAVYSRLDDVARPVTNWWVDDEWDVQRRRGLRPSSRTTGAIATP